MGGGELRPSVCVGRPVLEVPDVIVPFGVLGESSMALGWADVPLSRNPASLDRRVPPDLVLLLSPFVGLPCGRYTRSSPLDGSERPNLALGDLRTLVSPDERALGVDGGFGNAPYDLIPLMTHVRRARQVKHDCCMLIILN